MGIKLTGARRLQARLKAKERAMQREADGALGEAATELERDIKSRVFPAKHVSRQDAPGDRDDDRHRREQGGSGGGAASDCDDHEHREDRDQDRSIRAPGQFRSGHKSFAGLQRHSLRSVLDRTIGSSATMRT